MKGTGFFSKEIRIAHTEDSGKKDGKTIYRDVSLSSWKKGYSGR